MTRVAVLVASVLVLSVPAFASESRPTLAEVEREVICPTCHTTLDLSSSPIADQMRAFIRERIAAGDTKSEIKDTLVAEFGQGVLAAPPASGFNLLAWVLPLAGGAAGAAGLAVLARRWRRSQAPGVERSQSPNGRPSLDPRLERRVDEELARFDG